MSTGQKQSAPSGTTAIYISNPVGRCPVCGATIFDCGYSDDPDLWEHEWNALHS